MISLDSTTRTEVTTTRIDTTTTRKRKVTTARDAQITRPDVDTSGTIITGVTVPS
jgi:hypothetical protein